MGVVRACRGKGEQHRASASVDSAVVIYCHIESYDVVSTVLELSITFGRRSSPDRRLLANWVINRSTAATTEREFLHL